MIANLPGCQLAINEIYENTKTLTKIACLVYDVRVFLCVCVPAKWRTEKGNRCLVHEYRFTVIV